MIRKAYDTDLTDQEWAQLESYFSKHRTYKWSKRELVNATLYITKTGCQ
ncbi:transposase [Streptococcus pluranimalium]